MGLVGIGLIAMPTDPTFPSANDQYWGFWILNGGKLTESVLPDPVEATPTMSRPLRAIGQPCDCMAVGSLNPNFLEKKAKNRRWH